jgi:hypothetical protein
MYIALILTAVLGILILSLRQELALSAFLFGVIFFPPLLFVSLGSLHFYLFRLLLVFAWLRLLSRGEIKFGKIRSTDWAVVSFIGVTAVAFVAARQNIDAIINACGSGFNAASAYLFFRCCIKDIDDVKRTARMLAFAALLVAIGVLIERETDRNMFSLFFGIDQMADIRDGRVRCQGPFAHALLAGAFGATLFPTFVALWPQSRSRMWALFGGCASTIIVINAAASGPVLSLASACAGLMAWNIRFYMRFVRWSIVSVIISLQLAMNAPVWALIGRASVFGASSSDHRFRLVDSFIRNFKDWWLFGTNNTDAWGWLIWDVSNNYVRVGVDGGLLALILFIVIITSCFKAIGRKLHTPELVVGDKKFLWGLGTSLFAHLVAFMDVSYWDQSVFLWYLLLAMIVAATRPNSTARVYKHSRQRGANEQTQLCLDHASA